MSARSPRGRALILTAVSLCGWCGWELVRELPHPFADISAGTYSDHFSHMNAARLFPRVGLDLWRKPLQQHGHRITPQEMTAMPADIQRPARWNGAFFAIEGWPTSKPFASSWIDIPRLYPPGDLLLFAPAALAYHFTPLSFSGANRWLMVLLLLYAHASLYLFFELLFRERLSAVAIGTCLLVYAEVMYWTLEGFYDAATIVPLVWCARFLRERRGLAALVAYAAAAFIQFKAYFLGPFALYAAWIILRDRQWRAWRVRDWLAVLAAALMAGCSLGTFFLERRVFGNLPANNPVGLAGADINYAAVLGFVATIVLICAVVVRARAWRELVTIVWLSGTLLIMRGIYGWYHLVPLALLAVPLLDPGATKPSWVRGARFAFVACVAGAMLAGQALPAP